MSRFTSPAALSLSLSLDRDSLIQVTATCNEFHVEYKGETLPFIWNRNSRSAASRYLLLLMIMRQQNVYRKIINTAKVYITDAKGVDEWGTGMTGDEVRSCCTPAAAGQDSRRDH